MPNRDVKVAAFKNKFSCNCDIGRDSNDNKVIRISDINWPQDYEDIDCVLLRLRGCDIKSGIVVDDDKRFQRRISPGITKLPDIKVPLYGDFELCYELCFADGIHVELQQRKKLNFKSGQEKPYLKISKQRLKNFTRIQAVSDCWPLIERGVWLEYGDNFQPLPVCRTGDIKFCLPTADCDSIRVRCLPEIKDFLDIKEG